MACKREEKPLIRKHEIEDAGEEGWIGSRTAERCRTDDGGGEESAEHFRLARNIAERLNCNRFRRFSRQPCRVALHFHLPFRKKSALPFPFTQGIGASNGGRTAADRQTGFHKWRRP